MITVCCKSTFIQTGTFVKWEDCEVWVVLSILPSKPTCAYPSKANDDWEAGLFSDARYGTRKKIISINYGIRTKSISFKCGTRKKIISIKYGPIKKTVSIKSEWSKMPVFPQATLKTRLRKKNGLTHGKLWNLLIAPIPFPWKFLIFLKFLVYMAYKKHAYSLQLWSFLPL